MARTTIARTTIGIGAALALLAVLGAAEAQAGRAGSHRVGGHGPNGKGSHYVGGHRSTAVGRFLNRHL